MNVVQVAMLRLLMVPEDTSRQKFVLTKYNLFFGFVSLIFIILGGDGGKPPTVKKNRETKPKTYLVEKHSVERFAEAIEDENPLYLDKKSETLKITL